MTEFTTVGELLELSEATIPHPLIDFILAGAGSELALRRNRSALQRIAIEQRLLATPDEVDISTTFFGAHLECPIITAPMGMVSKIQPDGDIEMARGASREGALAVVANETGSPLDRIGRESGGPLLAQFRCTDDQDKQSAKIELIHSTKQFIGICVTVDGPVETRIDRYIEAGSHVKEPELPLRVPGHRFTWKHFDWLRDQTALPIGVKGIMHESDARDAIAHGADFVWVSNHGARKLDRVRATIDVLGDVVDAVGDSIPVVVDSGFQRGSEVLIALAKGATLVAFGKLSACALGLGSSSGVSSLFCILKAELHNALACSGHVSLAELSRSALRSIDY